MKLTADTPVADPDTQGRLHRLEWILSGRCSTCPRELVHETFPITPFPSAPCVRVESSSPSPPRTPASHEAGVLTGARSGYVRRRKALSAGPIKSTTSQSSPLANFSNARRVGWLPPRSSRPTYERSKPDASANCSCDIWLSKRLSRAAAPSIFATFSSKLRAPLGRPDFGAVFGRIDIRPRLQDVSYLRHVINNSKKRTELYLCSRGGSAACQSCVGCGVLSELRI